MVYRGASKGCKTCRVRHIKCDLERPCCNRCVGTRRVCPGYDDVFGHILRDETLKVSQRVGKLVVSHHSSSQFMKTRNAVACMMPNQTVPVPRAMLLHVEALALDFFFLNYGFNQNNQGSHGFPELIVLLYPKSSYSSPLVFATTAFAVNIYSLWGLEGGSFIKARRLYHEAVVRTKEALFDSAQLKSDELLLATLILESYDNLASSFQKTSRRGLHTAGSVALIRHRATLADNSELFGQIATVVQSKLIHDELEGLPNNRHLIDTWHSGITMKKTPAVEADRLALKFIGMKDRLRLCMSDHDYAAILSRAIVLKEDCTKWLNTIPSSWQPISVSTHDIDESIKRAGIYDACCDVYANLSVANIQNWHRIIEIRVLNIIRHCLSRPLDLNNDLRAHIVESVAEHAQLIVDKICSSLPYHAGNITQTITPLLCDKVVFPRANVSDPTSYLHQIYPDSESQHARQIVSSGIWMIHGTLANLLSEIEPGGSTLPSFDLRPGQIEWIQSQILRLEKVFSLSNRLEVSGPLRH